MKMFQRKQCILLITLFSSALFNVANAISIVSADFGKHDGQSIKLVTLKNDMGMQVKITNYGATMTSLMVPDKHGHSAEITAGFNQLSSYFSDEYQQNNPYFGGVIGRYASFTHNGKFNLDGKSYQLSQNAGSDHLHGGTVGFDKHVWTIAKAYQENDAAVLKLTYTSPDGQEGYPGTLNVAVEYKLTNDNELKVRYLATTDKNTPVSLTHHAYFNLNGFKENVLDHVVQINSEAYLTPNADTNIPDGKETPVKGTATDFNKSKPLAKAFSKLPNGFEHYYLFNNPQGNLIEVANISEPHSGRKLAISTTEPGALFYTGRYTSNKLVRENGLKYGQFKAFCFETSKYPNGTNIPNSPRTYLKAGDIYDETTVFKFSW